MVPAALLASGAASIFSSGLSGLGQSFVARNDKDKSGGVSLDEFAKLLQGGKNLPGKAAASAGSVAPDEATTAKFKAIDTNSDGSIGKDEANAYTQQLVQQLQAALVDLQQAYGAGRNAGHHEKHAALASQFGAIDTNSDASISKDELMAFLVGNSGNAASTRADKLFAKADTDKDGALSKDELSAFDTAHKKRKKGQNGSDPIASLLQALDQTNASLTTTASSTLAATKAYTATP